MAVKRPAVPDETVASRSGHVFVVRLWKEELASDSDYRGTVRDVMTGAFRGFRDWSDLVAFLVAGLERGDSTSGGGSTKEA